MGLLLMLLASASFATMAAMIKGIGNQVPLVQLVFLRCLLALPFFLAVIHRRQLPYIVRARKLILIRTIFGMSAMYCFFYSLTSIPLADSIFIGRAQPLLVALFAPFVVGEKAAKEAWIAIIAGLAGVGVIMNPHIGLSAGAIAAFAGAFLSSLAHLMLRKLNRTDSPLVIVFNFLLLTGIFTGIASLPFFVMMSREQWLLIAGVSVFASCGQMLLTAAYRRDQAPSVAAASYSSVLLSVLYGYVFWHEMPGKATLLGGGLIISGGVWLIYRNWQSKTRSSPGQKSAS